MSFLKKDKTKYVTYVSAAVHYFTWGNPVVVFAKITTLLVFLFAPAEIPADAVGDVIPGPDVVAIPDSIWVTASIFFVLYSIFKIRYNQNKENERRANILKEKRAAAQAATYSR